MQRFVNFDPLTVLPCLFTSYNHRMSVVEPVFGNIASNKEFKHFSLRGKTKVNGQWNLFCLIQNIEKLANYGQLAA